MVSKGASMKVNFNIGVAGEEGSGKSTFIRALLQAYNNEQADFRITIVPLNELSRKSLNIRHIQWLENCTIPTSEKTRNKNDRRVHALFYLFTPHRVLTQHERMISSFAGLVPIIPVLSKADTLTFDERAQQLRQIRQLMNRVSHASPYLVFFEFEEDNLEDEPLSASVEKRPVSVTGSEHSERISETVEDSFLPHITTNTSFFPQVPAEKSESAQSSPCASKGYERVDFGPLSVRESDLSIYNTASVELASDTAGSVYSAQSNTSRTSRTVSSCRTSRTMNSTLIAPRVSNIFAVMCTNNTSGMRLYPWGSVNTLDENISDLPRLQRLVFTRGSVNSLRDRTQEYSMRIYHLRDQAEKQNMVTTTAVHNSHMRLLIVFMGVCFIGMCAINIVVLVTVFSRVVPLHDRAVCAPVVQCVAANYTHNSSAHTTPDTSTTHTIPDATSTTNNTTTTTAHTDITDTNNTTTTTVPTDITSPTSIRNRRCTVNRRGTVNTGNF